MRRGFAVLAAPQLITGQSELTYANQSDLGLFWLRLWALPACTVPPKEQPSTDIDDTAYADHVRVLASDEFLGRKPGTPGEDKTVSLPRSKDFANWA